LLLNIINYSIRGLIVVIGILLLSGIILSEIESQFRVMVGIIFVLFGSYRLLSYYMQNKKYRLNNDEKEDN